MASLFPNGFDVTQHRHTRHSQGRRKSPRHPFEGMDFRPGMIPPRASPLCIVDDLPSLRGSLAASQNYPVSHLSTLPRHSGYAALEGPRYQDHDFNLARQYLANNVPPPPWFTYLLRRHGQPQGFDDHLLRQCASNLQSYSLAAQIPHQYLTAIAPNTVPRSPMLYNNTFLGTGVPPVTAYPGAFVQPQPQYYQQVNPYQQAIELDAEQNMYGAAPNICYQAPYVESDYGSDLEDAEYQRQMWEEFVARTGLTGVLYELDGDDGSNGENEVQRRLLQGT